MTLNITTLISFSIITLLSSSCVIESNSDPLITDLETNTATDTASTINTELEMLEEGEFLGSFMNVRGLRYQTASQSGVTSENGNFIYRENESITFYLGDSPLPEVKAKAKLSPFDIYGENYPAQKPENYESASLSLTAFITMFDYDNQPENGIELTDEIINLINQYQFDFENPLAPISLTTLDDPLIIAKQNSLLKTTSNEFDPEQALIHLYSWMEKDLFVYSGKKVERRTDEYNIQYNFDGNILNSIQRFENNSLDGWIDYFYVDDNLSEIIHNNLRDGESYFDDRYTFHYDEHNFLNRVNLYRNNFIKTQTWLYDSFGIAQSHTSYEGITIEYSYDEKGRRIIVEPFDLDSNGSVDEVLKYIEIEGNKILIGEDRDANGFYEISTDINVAENEHTIYQDLNLDNSYEQVSYAKYNMEGGELFYKIDYQNDGDIDYIRTTNYSDGLIDNIQILEYGELIEQSIFHYLNFDKFWFETIKYNQNSWTKKIHFDGSDDYIELNYYTHSTGLEFLGDISLFLTKVEIYTDGDIKSEIYKAISDDENYQFIEEHIEIFGAISPTFFDLYQIHFNNQLDFEYTDNGRIKAINMSLEGEASRGDFVSLNLDYSDYEEVIFIDFYGEIDSVRYPRQTFQYERNDENDLIGINWDLFSDGYFEYQTEYNNGALISKSVQPSDYKGDYYSSIHTYNDAGQLLTERLIVTDDGSAQTDNVFTYYDSGLLKNETDINFNRVLDYEYNDLNLLKFKNDSIENTLYFSTEYFYENITN